jgi:cytochrome c
VHLLARNSPGSGPFSASIFFRIKRIAAVTLVAACSLSFPAAAAPFNPTAAEALMQDSGCNKCHKLDKKKDGPAYRDVAAKYRGKPDAEASVTHHVTSGEMVKFDDGHEEKHKKVKTTNPAEIKNLVDWILAMEGGKPYESLSRK